ncbi:hypothetical protein BJ165DRAFT_1613778 [Panaeolus papilionaceus]|nr:hypothetical protein BJ165DRAFT_1613778 [Panaeolus papilionaceus]
MNFSIPLLRRGNGVGISYLSGFTVLQFERRSPCPSVLPRCYLFLMTEIFSIQEIVDLIVDHLVQDILLVDQRHPWQYQQPSQPYAISLQLHELKSCALINKAFTSRSQKHLFSKIRIRAQLDPWIYPFPETEWTCPTPEPALEEGSLQRIGRLTDIFYQKPRLAMHLHTIDICSRFGYLLGSYNSLKQLMGLLRDHGNPRNIRICYFQDGQPGDDIHMPPYYDFQQSIGITLESLECNHLEVPVWFISNNPQLKSLDVSCCTSAEDEETYPRIPLSSRPRLKSLTVRSSWSVLESLLRHCNSGRSAVDFSSLHSLHLYPTSGDRVVSSVQQIVSIAGSSLSEIIMFTWNDSWTYSRRLDLSSCTNLRTAKLGTAHKVLGIDVYLPITKQKWFQNYTSLRWDAMDAEIYRISNAAVATSRPITCNLHIQFDRNYIYTENYDAAVKECEEFTEGLRTGHFPMTTSNERIEFKAITKLDVGPRHWG